MCGTIRNRLIRNPAIDELVSGQLAHFGSCAGRRRQDLGESAPTDRSRLAPASQACQARHVLRK
eukprot:13288935-Alexandrium_andersonii.AAC.1